MNKNKSPIINKSLVLFFIRYLLEKDKKFIDDLLALLNETKDTRKILTNKQLKTIWLYKMQQGDLYCSICGNPITESHKRGIKMTKDHIIPQSRGGSTDASNLEPAHEICNIIKADTSVEEWERCGEHELNKNGISVNHLKTIYEYKKKTR